MCVRHWLWRCAVALRKLLRRMRGSTISSPSTTAAAGIRHGAGASPDGSCQPEHVAAKPERAQVEGQEQQHPGCHCHHRTTRTWNRNSSARMITTPTTTTRMAVEAEGRSVRSLSAIVADLPRVDVVDAVELAALVVADLAIVQHALDEVHHRRLGG